MLSYVCMLICLLLLVVPSSISIFRKLDQEAGGLTVKEGVVSEKYVISVPLANNVSPSMRRVPMRTHLGQLNFPKN